jgi:hypothetical protein
MCACMERSRSAPGSSPIHALHMGPLKRGRSVTLPTHKQWLIHCLVTPAYPLPSIISYNEPPPSPPSLPMSAVPFLVALLTFERLHIHCMVTPAFFVKFSFFFSFGAFNHLLQLTPPPPPLVLFPSFLILLRPPFFFFLFFHFLFLFLFLQVIILFKFTWLSRMPFLVC